MQERLRAIEQKLLPDEYHVATRLVGEAQRLMSSPPALPLVSEDPFTVGEVSEGWIASLIDRKDAEDRMQRRRAVLMELASSARSRCTSATAAIRDEVLAGYHIELVRLLDDVAVVAEELGGIDTAEEAIAADCSAAWKRLSGLADEYAVLRAAQRARMDSDTLIRARSTQGGEDCASDLHIANLDDIWPEWRTGGAANGVTITHVGGPDHRYEPWPASQPQLLLWLAASRAEPWVPTQAQLHRLWAERQNRANTMPTEPERPAQRLGAPLGRTVKRIESATTAGGF